MPLERSTGPRLPPVVRAREVGNPVSAEQFLPVPFAHSLAVLLEGEVVHAEGDLQQRFPLASVTKVIATRAALVAVERGMLALSDPLGPPGSTVRHLMCHASGLAMDSETVIAHPGARRIYSNTGIEVLGAGMEAATATPSSRWIEETVLEPLGMDATDVPGSPAYSGVANVQDLLALAAELLHPRLVGPELDAEATAPVFPDLVGVVPGYGRQTPCPWGLGVEIRGHKHPHWTAPGASPETFGHFGVSGSFIWVDRTRDMAAVFLGSEPFGPWHREHWSQLNQSILERFAPRS